MKYIFLISIIIIATACGKHKDADAASAGIAVNPTTQDPLAQSVKRGKEIYSELCVSCHLPNGKGVPNAYPPLNPSNWLTNKRTASIRGVKYGLQGEIEVNGKKYNGMMMSQGLDDQEVADVMNYTIQTWNKGDMVTVKEVAAVKKGE